ncbi:MAG: cytochrome c peroxidase [Ferruginibacter sp.]
MIARINFIATGYSGITALAFAAITLAGSCHNNHPLPGAGEAEKIELGRYLFFDRRLSVNNTRSCGTCHNPQFAFTDGYKRSLGAFADLHLRNTQPIFNLAEYKYFTSADSTIHTLQQQMNNPLFSTKPVEMGVNGHEEEILKRISTDKIYRDMFGKAGVEISWQGIKSVISSFMQMIESYRSPYDHFLAGDSNALSAPEKRGMQLFFSADLSCGKCHGGKNFSEPEVKDEAGRTVYYFNTGLYNVNDSGAYPLYDQGQYMQTKKISDMGKFRVPTLRNLAFTAPFYHDGSGLDLKTVINDFANAGRNIRAGLYKGNGIENPYKHPLIKGFSISEEDKANLAAFLLALSDSSITTNPAWQNPFTDDETKRNSNLQY